jgi:hypothetical protein
VTRAVSRCSTDTACRATCVWPDSSPYSCAVGSPDIAARFPPASLADVQERARVRQAEQNAQTVDPETLRYGELIDWKLSEFKRAVRRAPRPDTGG